MKITKPVITRAHQYALEQLSEKRFRHTQGVEALAIGLAQIWGADMREAQAAALLHDCTKEKNLVEQLTLMDFYNIMIEYDVYTYPQIIHADTGGAVAEHLFSLPSSVVNAIKCHTVGKPDMTVLEKVLYIADKCERGRDVKYENAKVIRQLAYTDLNGALIMALEDSLTLSTKKGQAPLPATFSALEFLRGK